MWSCIRGPSRTGSDNATIKGALGSRLKADGELDGMYTKVCKMPGTVLLVLLIRDRRE